MTVQSKFNLALCELYNENIHGKSNIDGHYLSIYTHSDEAMTDEEDSDDDDDFQSNKNDRYWELNSMKDLYCERYKKLRMKTHKSIRNYK